MDEQGNECPDGVEGEVVVEVSSNRPVGLFTRYVVIFTFSILRVCFFSSFLPFLKSNKKNKTKQKQARATVFFAEINNAVNPGKRFRASNLIY